MTVITKPILDKKDGEVIKEPLAVTVTKPKDTVTAAVPNRNAVVARPRRGHDLSRDPMGGIRCCLVFCLLGLTVLTGYYFFKAVSQHRRDDWYNQWHRQPRISRTCTLPIKVNVFRPNMPINVRAIYDHFEADPELTTHDPDLTETRITRVQETVEESIEVDADDQVKVDFTLDEEMETFVIQQMPQLSSGIYIHDFKFNKTVIVDTDNNRCFIMALNRAEIQTPKTFNDFVDKYQRGMYDLDVDEIRRDTIVVTPALENVCSDEYGFVISANCHDHTSYLLKDLEKSLEKRSADEKASGQGYQFVEFGGKSFIEYNIVNLHDL